MPYGESADGEIHLKKTFLLAAVAWGNSLHLSCEAWCEMNTDHPELQFCISQEENEVSKLSLGFFCLLCCASRGPLPFLQPSPSTLPACWNGQMPAFVSSLLPQQDHPHFLLPRRLFSGLLRSLIPAHKDTRARLSYFLRNTFSETISLPDLKRYHFTTFPFWPAHHL